MITSTQNAKIKWVHQLQTHNQARRAEHVFVVEGIRLIEEALQAGWTARLVLHTAGLNPRGQKLLAEYTLRGAPVEEAAPHVMQAACDTQTPQGILAVLEMKTLPPVSGFDFAVVLDGIRDPGNLGTILRTAAAAGAGAVWIPEGSVDVFAPKVLRSAMGAHFHIPVQTCTWAEIATWTQQQHMHLYLAEAGGTTPYTRADLRHPVALIVGGEASGGGDQARQLAHDTISIPMPGGMESLNAATAAAVLIYEVVRQRSTSSAGATQSHG